MLPFEMTFRGMRTQAKTQEDLIYIKSKLSNTAVTSLLPSNLKQGMKRIYPRKSLWH